MTFKVNNVYTYGSASFYFTAESGSLASLSILFNGRVIPVEKRFPQSRGAVIASDDTIYSVVRAVIEQLFTKVEQAPVSVALRDDEQDKENTVEVIRFLRPFAYHENLFGVTFIFTLDYEHRCIDVQFSVCNGDNFNRSEGVRRARENKNYISGIYMPDDIYHSNGKDGLIKWFVTRVPDEIRGDRNVTIYTHINTMRLVADIYANSSHNEELMAEINKVEERAAKVKSINDYIVQIINSKR